MSYCPWVLAQQGALETTLQRMSCPCTTLDADVALDWAEPAAGRDGMQWLSTS